MNKQDKLDEMVKKYSGTFPTFEELRADYVGGYSLAGNNVPTDVTYRREVFSKEQFQQRARELGYVNGYRYGIEYQTNGKKPDLPDDILIDAKCKNGTNEWCGWTDLDVSDAAWTAIQNRVFVTSFKIIDTRYKPADTSYLDKSEVATPEVTDAHWRNAPEWAVDIRDRYGKLHYTDGNRRVKEVDGSGWCDFYSVSEFEVVSERPVKAITTVNDSLTDDWYDYTNQKALRLPPVGEKVLFNEYSNSGCWKEVQVRGFWTEKENTSVWISSISVPNITPDKFRPLDHATRKSEAERKRVIDAVCAAMPSSVLSGRELIEHCYDAGFLRMPEDK